MVFSSIVFIFIFLPAVMILYRILPEKLRNGLLLTASLIFYAWGEPVYVLLMRFSIVFNYFMGRRLEQTDRRNLILVICVAVNIGMLCFFKYTDFAIDNLSRISGINIGTLKLALPIGISFYTFQVLSYIIDVYRGTVKVQRNIIDFGMYITFFPQLIAGPIVRYQDIENQLKGRTLNYDMVSDGIVRFAAGLGKKVLIANQCGLLWDEIYSYGGNIPALMAWTGARAFTFQIYYDFSGYSDMAIGLGKIFGFTFPENFRYPYESRSITEFWRRWHITLGVWFREYLYIPLGGNRRGTARQILNLVIVWALTGLWHGAGWNFIIWGLYYFVLIAAEKLFLGRILEKLPHALSHIYALLFIIAGWVLFACDDISVLGPYLKSMIGLGAGGSSPMSIYYLQTYGVLLFIAAFGSVHTVRDIPARLLKNEKALDATRFIFAFVMLAAATAFIIGDSYNPFLYFRF